MTGQDRTKATMRSLVVLVPLVLLVMGSVDGGAVPGKSDNPRQGRWFLSRNTVTKMVEERRLVTQVTPWSCVVVQPSLPACRHVRQLDIQATPPTPIAATQAPVTPGFYGEYNQVEPTRRFYLDTAHQDAYYADMVPVPNFPSPALTPALQNGWVPLMAREAPAPAPAPAPGSLFGLFSGQAPNPAPAPAPAAAPSPAKDAAGAAAAPAQSTAAASPAAPAAAPAAAEPPANAAATPASSTTPDKKNEQGWAEWLGLRGPTVTQTVIKYETTKYVDPDTVVTFSVRGCQPSKLPFDLPLCVPPPTLQSAQSPAQETQTATGASNGAPAPPPAQEATPEPPAATAPPTAQSESVTSPAVTLNAATAAPTPTPAAAAAADGTPSPGKPASSA